jgi:hypothetical protein
MITKHDYIPASIENLLDLIPPNLLQRIIEYRTTTPGDKLEVWEQRHIDAAENLCIYAEVTHGRQLARQTKALRTKLHLLNEQQ